MKVAVLEWICGGGWDPATANGQGLEAEGWAMLRRVAQGLNRCGHQAVVPLDTRRIPAGRLVELEKMARVHRLVPAENNFDFQREWLRTAEECDWGLVIAPETDGLLSRITNRLRSCGIRLLNAQPPFIDVASDKWATAVALIQHGISHPPTIPWNRLDDQWLAMARSAAERYSTAADNANRLWVLKPQDGAGAEGLELVDDHQLQRRLEQLRKQFDYPVAGQPAIPGRLLVQPWLPGAAYSCSGIIDDRGRCRWLPLVTQDFQRVSSSGVRTTGLRYIGCSLRQPPAANLEPPYDLLDQTLAAMGPGGLGWVGIDLLYSHETRQWTVIEVNPRCTTSLVALADGYSGNLVEELWSTAADTRPFCDRDWRPGIYRLPNDRESPIPSRACGTITR